MSSKESSPDRHPLGVGQAVLSWVCSLSHRLFPKRLPYAISVVDPYIAAQAEFDRRLEALQQAGEMFRASQITSEYEQEEHFDQLARLYGQVCGEMGLAWPPPPQKLNKEEFPMDADGEVDWWD